MDFMKTELASLAWKLFHELFLYRINTAKAPRRQKATNGSGCGISRFSMCKHARSQHAFMDPYSKVQPRFAISEMKKICLPQHASQATDPQSVGIITKT